MLNRFSPLGKGSRIDVEVGLGGKAQELLRKLNLIGAKRRAVGLGRTGFVGTAITNDGFAGDQGRLVGDMFGFPQCGIDCIDVHAIDLLDMPAKRFKSGSNILRKRKRRRTVQGDLVVVVEDDQAAQVQMSR